ncbi:MAG: PH domain-containing protein [Candidatus Thiodiazotropha sp. (ex Dulcina madagascariensis)]|nr:PH domain-containing protein [Candidatus Thiodiazotropha sp. (ex Dulcina madagascariensis)]
MGKYVKTNLITDEKIQYEGKTSFWSLLPKLLLGLILLPLYGIGLVFLASAAIAYYTTELAITNKRVIAKFGLIRRNTIEMNISKVESIQVDQGILGRLFNFGSVLVSGAGDPKAPIPGISKPLRFRKMFFEVQEGGSKEVQPATSD